MRHKLKANISFILLISSLFINILLDAQEPLEEILTIQNPWQDYQFSSYIQEGSGDVNGDGYNDFIITKNDNNDFILYDGEVYIYFGNPNINSTPHVILTGIENEMFGGYNATIAGDINGDGFNDVIVSAIAAEPSGAGAVYVFLGGDPFDTDVDYVFHGVDYAQVLYINFFYGAYLSATADFNNDGYNDLVIGGNGPTMSWEGQVDIFLGGEPFDMESDFCLYGQNYFDNYGSFITGDLNGDGFDEFLAHHTVDNEYILDIYEGGNDFPTNSPVASLNMDFLGYNGQKIICQNISIFNSDALIYTHTISSNSAKYLKILYLDTNFNIESIDSLNCEYNNPGTTTNLFCSDINNDSTNDIIISFERDYFSHYAGKTMIFYGGTLLDTIPDLTMTGSSNFEYFGKVGYNLGDVNGDGNTEILLGSSTYPIGTITDYVTIYTEENLVSAQNDAINISTKLYNFPNPFNPITEIRFETSDYSLIEKTKIEIFNLRGQRVKIIPINCSLLQPINSVFWDGTDKKGNPVSSGVYLYKLRTGNKIQAVNKCLLLK